MSSDDHTVRKANTSIAKTKATTIVNARDGPDSARRINKREKPAGTGNGFLIASLRSSIRSLLIRPTSSPVKSATVDQGSTSLPSGHAQASHLG